MRKFTLMFVALLMATMTFAQKTINVSTSAPMKLIPSMKLFSTNKPGTKITSSNYEVVEIPEGAEPQNYVVTATRYVDGTNDADYSGEGQIIFNDEEVYIRGLSYYLPEAWVKGEMDGETITIPAGQYLGNYGGQYDMWLGSYQVTMNDNTPVYSFGDIVLTYDEETGVLSTKDRIVTNGKPDELYWYSLFYNLVMTPGEVEKPEVVEVPEGLELADYIFKATKNSYDKQDNLVQTPVAMPLKVGIDGNDIYVQGLCTYLPEAWVKGTLGEGVATFATGQYFGNYGDAYDLFLVGYDNDAHDISDILFEIDAETGTLSTEQDIYINLKQNTIYYAAWYTDITMEKVTDLAAVPADPEISGFAPYDEGERYGSISFVQPLESVEGENLLADKLYYVIYTKSVVDNTEAPYVFTPDLYIKIEEDMTYVPYTFNDDYDFNEFQGVKIVYLNFPTSEYKAFGVQAFYLGGNEVNASNLVWKENPETTGISAATAGSVAKVSYTDLSGRTVAQPTHGLYIMTMKMADGTKKSVKMLIK